MDLLTLIELGKVLACAAAIALIFIAYLADKHALKSPARWVTIVLIALAAFSIPAYLDFGYYPKHGRLMNPHGWFHYYLGAKYSKEVGYYDLYPAVVVASAEIHGKPVHDRVRDMHTYSNTNARAILREKDSYRALFSDNRWSEFKTDVAYFESITLPKRWPGVLHDKGYNATPTWNMLGDFLTNLTSTSSKLQMMLLFCLDPLLIVFMLAFIYRTFGSRVMLFVLVYFCTHFAFFMYGVNEIRGAFLRWDWLALIGISVCLLKQERVKTAAILMAWAGMSRIFPLIFLFGPGALCLWHIIRTRRVARSDIEFFGVLAITSAAIILASMVWDGGIQHWKDFFAKIALHDAGLSSQRTGFKYVFINTFEGVAGKQVWFDTHKASWYFCLVISLIAAFFCVRRLKNYEALAFSYVPVFFLSAPTTYYQIALLIPLLWFLSRLDSIRGVLGAAAVFFLSIAFIVLNITGFHNSQWALSGMLSWLLFAFAGYMIWAAYRTGNPRAHGGSETC